VFGIIVHKIGNYNITLKVSGGGKYQNKYPVTVQVKPVPYLLVQEPTETATINPASDITVRAQLLQAEKPLRGIYSCPNL
jgi:hypothetical protein